jgi:hypothetical protein
MVIGFTAHLSNSLPHFTNTVTNGFQRPMFPLLWAPELSPCLSYQHLIAMAHNDWTAAVLWLLNQPTSLHCTQLHCLINSTELSRSSCIASSGPHTERCLQLLFYCCVTSSWTWRAPLLPVYGPLPSNGPIHHNIMTVIPNEISI